LTYPDAVFSFISSGQAILNEDFADLYDEEINVIKKNYYYLIENGHTSLQIYGN